MKKHTLLLACAMRILLNLIALPSRGRLAIRGEPALKRHSDIARWMLRSVSNLCSMRHASYSLALRDII